MTDSAALLLEQATQQQRRRRWPLARMGAQRSPATGTPITVEGRWAYFPCFHLDRAAKGREGPQGAPRLQGLLGAFGGRRRLSGAPNPFEKSYTLPPIATDHHHEFKDGQLFHTHGKGGAHRHV